MLMSEFENVKFSKTINAWRIPNTPYMLTLLKAKLPEKVWTITVAHGLTKFFNQAYENLLDSGLSYQEFHNKQLALDNLAWIVKKTPDNLRPLQAHEVLWTPDSGYFFFQKQIPVKNPLKPWVVASYKNPQMPLQLQARDFTRKRIVHRQFKTLKEAYNSCKNNYNLFLKNPSAYDIISNHIASV